MGKLAENVGKDKTTAIYPYLFHLYKEEQVLKLVDVVIYNIRYDFIKHGCTLDLKLDS